LVYCSNLLIFIFILFILLLTLYQHLCSLKVRIGRTGAGLAEVNRSFSIHFYVNIRRENAIVTGIVARIPVVSYQSQTVPIHYPADTTKKSEGTFLLQSKANVFGHKFLEIFF
jgi:hypothetical protein